MLLVFQEGSGSAKLLERTNQFRKQEVGRRKFHLWEVFQAGVAGRVTLACVDNDNMDNVYETSLLLSGDLWVLIKDVNLSFSPFKLNSWEKFYCKKIKLTK